MIKLNDLAEFLEVSKSRAYQLMKTPAKRRHTSTQKLLDTQIPLFLAEQEAKFEAEYRFLCKLLMSKEKRNK